ncbi:hypothetical protein [uncultured Fibrobacter sp.]|uniref:hypothetical protein n=1 Tax=uncultured Fibrobacter sp. TaxID=261512 RepID=UPI0025DEF32B|nr:hypothetical protein [uncultured Fibrobacter sp.]
MEWIALIKIAMLEERLVLIEESFLNQKIWDKLNLIIAIYQVMRKKCMDIWGELLHGIQGNSLIQKIQERLHFLRLGQSSTLAMQVALLVLTLVILHKSQIVSVHQLLWTHIRQKVALWGKI